MKTTLRLLSLLLCFELVMAPIAPQLSTTAWAGQDDCDKGEVWDGQLNQCLTSQEVAKVQNAVKACQKITGAEEQKKCYGDNAKAALDRADVKDNRESFTNKDGDATFASTSDIWSARGAANAATVAVPLFFLTKVMADKKARKNVSCKPASIMLMYSGAAALVVGEVLTYLMHNKKLDRMKSKLNELKSVGSGSKDAQNSQATEIQSQAFELLAQNEDSIADITKTKKVMYLTATGLFAAGTAMATIETFQLKSAYATFAKDPATSKATIDRLTCGTGLTKEQNDFAETTQKNKDEAATKAANEQTQKAAKAQEVAEKKSGFLKEMNLAKTIAQAAVSKGIEAVSTAKSNGQEPSKESADALKKNQDELDAITACQEKKEGLWQWKDGQCVQVDEQVNYNNFKVLDQAKKNLKYAQTMSDFMQLVAEIESIEYENYSKTDYLDPTANEELKNIPLPTIASQLMAQMFISNAYSQVPFDGSLQGSSSSTGGDEAVLNTMGNNVLTGNNGVTAKTAEATMKAKWANAIYKPVTRIAINGLLGTWMGIMSSHMIKQQKVSEARAKKLREMKEEFNFQAGLMNCSEADRKSTAKPYCYCYTSDNQRNPARATSSICNKLWGTNSGTVASNGETASQTKTCVDRDYGMDPSCSCKNRRTSDGKNACLKAGEGFNMTGINPGTFKMLNVGTSPANDLFNGNASAGSLDTPGLANNAMRIKKAADDMAKKTAPEAVKAAKDLEKGLLAATAGMSMGGIGGSNSSSPSLAGMTPAQATKALEDELKDSTPEVNKAAGYNGTVSPSSPAEPQLEFGMTDDQLATQELEVAEAMKQDLDYGDNDINKGSKTNIFEVLSNRYQRSGMRRLFEGGEKVAPDKPAKSDINQ